MIANIRRMGRTSNAKERLLEAVIELIWTGSYGSTSVDQICERAGVKKGSFYHFFESRKQRSPLLASTTVGQSIARNWTRFSPLSCRRWIAFELL